MLVREQKIEIRDDDLDYEVDMASEFVVPELSQDFWPIIEHRTGNSDNYGLRWNSAANDNHETEFKNSIEDSIEYLERYTGIDREDLGQSYNVSLMVENDEGDAKLFDVKDFPEFLENNEPADVWDETCVGSPDYFHIQTDDRNIYWEHCDGEDLWGIAGRTPATSEIAEFYTDTVTDKLDDSAEVAEQLGVYIKQQTASY